MKKKRVNRVLEVAAPVVRRLVEGTWSIFERPLNARFLVAQKRKLLRDVERHLQFLFTDYHGRLIANARELPEVIRLPKVTIAADDLVLVIEQDVNRDLAREFVCVSLAPKHDPNDWYELSRVLRVLDPGERTNDYPEYPLLSQVARLVEPRMTKLIQGFSEAEFRKNRKRFAAP